MSVPRTSPSLITQSFRSKSAWWINSSTQSQNCCTACVENRSQRIVEFAGRRIVLSWIRDRKMGWFTAADLETSAGLPMGPSECTSQTSHSIEPYWLKMASTKEDWWRRRHASFLPQRRRKSPGRFEDLRDSL